MSAVKPSSIQAPEPLTSRGRSVPRRARGLDCPLPEANWAVKNARDCLLSLVLSRHARYGRFAPGTDVKSQPPGVQIPQLITGVAKTRGMR
jgi:hypothetical protein